ncbi:TPA: hypothetical protein PBO82_000626 [Escherichia coli]|nr:hypothetical protein [Escherichia coli]
MTDELLPEVTATSHPPTPQLTDAACAEPLSLLLNPEFEPATAPAGDTSNQAPHWLVCTVAKRGYSQRVWRNFVQICFFISRLFSNHAKKCHDSLYCYFYINGLALIGLVNV